MQKLGTLALALLAAGLLGCGGGQTPPKGATGRNGELGRAWLALRAEVRAVDSLAAAGNLAGARHHARILAETAALLPNLSGAYVSTRQGPLTYALRDMGELVDSLNAAADRGDGARVGEQIRKLERNVAYIGGLYPTGSLPGAAQTPGGAYARRPEAEAAGEAAVSRVTLDCPMHPEIRRSVPPDSVGRATCPKCGMDLVSATRTAPNSDTAPAPGAAGSAPVGAAPVIGKAPTATPTGRIRHMDHNPRHGGQFAMQGDYHLELVTRPDGRIELYVYDAWTEPLPLKGSTGTLTLEINEGASGTTEQVVSLRVSPRTTGLLSALAGDLKRATAVTARLSLPDTSLALTFPLGAEAPPTPEH